MNRGPRPVAPASEPRASTLAHWESYWRAHADIDRTYSTGGRLAREILAEGPVAGRRILEVGAGSGRDSLALAEAGAQTFVLDYSPASLALVRDQARARACVVHMVRADARAMPFRDGTFDVIFHQGLLEHFREPLPMLAENARAAARGGIVVVDVPQTVHVYTLLKQLMMLANAWFAGWETQFTPRQLERLVADSGLVVRRTYGEWMVPGLAYRVTREVLKRGLRVTLPLTPRGPVWWERGWTALRRRLGRQRVALYTCHVIGTIAEKT